MAASIPVLRVLIREVKANTVRLYASSSTDTYHTKSYGAGGLARSNTVVVAARHRRGALETFMRSFKSILRPKSDDSSSGKSVLVHSSGKGMIVQTQEINIVYHERDDKLDVYDMGDNRV